MQDAGVYIMYCLIAWDCAERQRVREKEHKHLLSERQALKASEEQHLDANVQLNKSLASRYRQLRNRALVRRAQYLDDVEQRVAFENKLKDLQQVCDSDYEWLG